MILHKREKFRYELEEVDDARSAEVAAAASSLELNCVTANGSEEGNLAGASSGTLVCLVPRPASAAMGMASLGQSVAPLYPATIGRHPKLNWWMSTYQEE